MMRLNLQYFGGRGSAGSRSGGSKVEFYEGAPQNVIDAVNNARDYLAQELGSNVLSVLPNRITRTESSSKNSTLADSRKNSIAIWSGQEKNITTDVMVHEYTHNVTNITFGDKASMDRARKDVYASVGKKATKANDTKYISKYASTNSAEFFSEAMSEGYKNAKSGSGNTSVHNAAIKYLKSRVGR